jgi:hypothetical protein
VSNTGAAAGTTRPHHWKVPYGAAAAAAAAAATAAAVAVAVLPPGPRRCKRPTLPLPSDALIARARSCCRLAPATRRGDMASMGLRAP